MEHNQFVKGSLTTIILKLLKENDRMYGYEMTKTVREMTGDKVNITEAALYPALHKLVEAGHLSTTTEIVDGRQRKYYTLTKKGKKESIEKVDALKEAMESIKLILNSSIQHG